jgi:hypothetical protein
MIERKKKLRLMQFFLLIFGLIIIYLTYYNKEISTEQTPTAQDIKTKSKRDKSFQKFLTIVENVENPAREITLSDAKRMNTKNSDLKIGDKIKKVLTIVENVENPAREITLSDAKRMNTKNSDLKIGDTIFEESLLKNSDVFFDIEYSGFDLQGNRYLLNSEEAYVDEINSEIIYMQIVNAMFYFKDDTTLYVEADTGIYNNRTLDMKFEQNVKANYQNSELYAEKAEYSNSKSYLSIYENVRINDIKGNLIADKLLFDITSQMLDITSFNNGKINANVNLDEKKF